MIRRANLSDVPWLLEQLRQFDRFFGGKKSLFPDDPEVATAIVGGLVETQPFFISESKGTPIGFIAGALAPHPYNPSLLVLAELFWWVSPEFRGSLSGARLLAHFIEHGEQNADWIQLTLEAKSPVSEQSLLKQGFQLYERSYLREVNNAA